MRKPPPGLKTPPYVTAQPVITHRKLTLPSLTSSSNSPAPSLEGDKAQSKSTLRFIVLATDGLWDELSSAEVVALVGGHLAGLKGPVPKSELDTLVPTKLSEDPTAQTIEGKDRRRNHGTEGTWAFVDTNVSQHLIRNAFGGADTDSLRKLISIPAPLSRSFRDDVTVTVIWWEDAQEAAKQESLQTPVLTSRAKL